MRPPTARPSTFTLPDAVVEATATLAALEAIHSASQTLPTADAARVAAIAAFAAAASGGESTQGLEKAVTAAEDADRLADIRLALVTEALEGAESAVVASVYDAEDVILKEHAASEIGNFWERVGHLVRQDHIQAQLVFEYLSPEIANWWGFLSPSTAALRNEHETPGICEHFEWLAGTVAEMRQKAGLAPRDDAYLARTIESSIQWHLEGLRAVEELRTVIVRPAAETALATEPGPE